MKKLLHSLVLCVGVSLVCQSQTYQHFLQNDLPIEIVKEKLSPELGVFAGLSTYTGDLTERYIEPLDMHFAIGLYYRRPLSMYWNLKGNLLWGKLSGDDAHSSVESGLWKRNLQFTTYVYELSAVVEFMPFVLESKFYRFSPYAFAGIGAFYFNPKTEIGGEIYKLQTYRTEGIEYSLFQYCLPIGAGIKTTIKEYGTVGIEIGMRKTFTDYIDDVSSNYTSYFSNGSKRVNTQLKLAYRTPEVVPNANLVPQPGAQRGNPEKTDWYMFFGMTVGFTLSR